MTHRTLTALILSILLAQAAFGGGRSRGSHPPTVSPEGLRPDFAAASVTGTVSAVNGNLISVAGGLITLDITGATLEGDRSAGLSPRIVAGSRIIAITRTVDVPAGAPIPVYSVIVFQTADVTLSGTIQAINVPANTLTVLGLTVQATATTTFGTNFPTFAPILSVAGLSVGNVVSVQASVQENTLRALHVQVLTPTSAHPTFIRGTVRSIESGSWVIASDRGSDVRVGVNAETKIVGPPLVGDRVEVIARQEATGELTALSIVRIEPPLTRFLGIVKTMSASKWTILTAEGAEMSFVVNELTRIEGHFAIGDRVIIVASTNSSGVLTAVSIAAVDFRV